jgi:translation initiation factor IF-3
MFVDHKINDDIIAESVRVIGTDGKQIGIMDLNEALDLAYDEGLDLVLLNDKQEPFTCQIMNYSKFKYEQSKKQKENKKKNKPIVTKDIIISCRIDTNDLNTRIKQAKKFLDNKNKVNFSVRLRGREKLYINQAREVLEIVQKECEEHCSSTEIKVVNESTITLILIPEKK